jgi:uncharacterized protein
MKNNPKMDKSKLEEFNHWWIRGQVDKELSLPFKRDIFSEVEKRMNGRFIIALVGLRRTGKTTIIYQIIEKLIEDKTNPKDIVFFSFDETSVKIGEVLETYKELYQKDLRQEKVYIFLDEIQKCDGWENELKKYYDLYPKLKFVITGSESLFIKKKSKETLAGRIFESILFPFTFVEYLKFNNITKEEFRYETKIKPLFLKFIEKGGFPETFVFQSEKDFREYIKALVVDKIVYRDIPKRFKIEDPEFLRTLLELIATNPGMYIDYQSLSKQFNKDRRVIRDYLSYLKESFLITLLGNYRKGSITTLRKKKRAYPTDNGLIYLYKLEIDSAFFGRMVESQIVNTLKANNFWKNGNEIDIVYNNIPIEVKYQEKINSVDFKPLREFMKKFSKKEAVLITKNEEEVMNFEEGAIKLIPAWKWLLEN